MDRARISRELLPAGAGGRGGDARPRQPVRFSGRTLPFRAWAAEFTGGIGSNGGSSQEKVKLLWYHETVPYFFSREVKSSWYRLSPTPLLACRVRFHVAIISLLSLKSSISAVNHISKVRRSTTKPS